MVVTLAVKERDNNIIKLAIKALIDELEANKIYKSLAQRYRDNKQLYKRFIFSG